MTSHSHRWRRINNEDAVDCECGVKVPVKIMANMSPYHPLTEEDIQKQANDAYNAQRMPHQ